MGKYNINAMYNRLYIIIMYCIEIPYLQLLIVIIYLLNNIIM